MSQLSLHSSGPQNEDWDCSLINEPNLHPSINAAVSSTTPRNSIIVPGEEAELAETSGRAGPSMGKRSLSKFLRVQKGTDLQVNAEEASRVADVLGQWINSNSAAHEGEDDFFARSQDDLSLPKRSSPHETPRPRGQSESIVYSRPPSSVET